MKHLAHVMVAGIISVVTTITFTTSIAQDRIFDIPLAAPIKNIEAIGIGDSVLFSFVDAVNFKRKMYWISKGKSVQWILPTSPFTTVKEDDGLYLYYLEKQKKSVMLKAYVADKSGALKITDMQVPLDGEILGFYEEHGIKLVLFDRKNFSLSFLNISKNKLSDTKRYNLPIEFKWGDEEVDFYSPNNNLNSFKGFSNIKMFPEGNLLYITIDRERSSAASPSVDTKPNVRPQGTIVLKLHLTTSDISKSAFPASRYAPFSSFVMDGKLFRTLPNPKAFLVSIYNLETSTLILQDSIKPFLNFKCYFRYGKKSIIGHKAPYYTVMRESEDSQPVIFVDRAPAGYQIQFGTYYSKSGGNDGYGADDAKIADQVGNAVLQYQEKAGVHRYFNYIANDSAGYVKSDKASTTLRELIDDYEVDNIPRIDYKTYVNYKDGVAGLYTDSQLKRLFVIYYHTPRKQKSTDPNSLGF